MWTLSSFSDKTRKFKISSRTVVCRSHESPEDMINWTDYKRYLKYADSVPKTANIKSYVGHSTLRIAVMGLKIDNQRKKKWIR